jgi:hypothetical protein
MLGVAAGIALIVIGAVVAAAAGGRVWLQATGLALGGIGGVLAVAAAFWLVGRSEDREREGHE